MNCSRCHGLMVGDMCWDLEETQGMWIHTARCMNCGHLADPLMEKHRQQAATADPPRTIASAMGLGHAVGEM